MLSLLHGIFGHDLKETEAGNASADEGQQQLSIRPT
jgi:hypothetical protein